MAFWAAIPYVAQAGVSIWNAIQGNRAGKQAEREKAARDRLLGEGQDLAQEAYDDWKNGEAAFLRGEIAKARRPGLSEQGLLAKTDALEGQNRAYRNLTRAAGPNASTFLALDLEGAKRLGQISLMDAIQKKESVKGNYDLLRRGGSQVRGGLQSAINARAGVVDSDRKETQRAGASAWSGVASGMMNLATMFGRMGQDQSGGGSGGVSTQSTQVSQMQPLPTGQTLQPVTGLSPQPYTTTTYDPNIKGSYLGYGAAE